MNSENMCVEIERSPSFTAIAQRITILMQTLPLDSAQSDSLAELFVNQITEAERTAFMQGFDMGVKIGLHRW